MYVRELIVRYRLKRVSGIVSPNGTLTMPAGAAATFVKLLGRETVEVCGLFCLSTKLEIVAYHALSRGTINHTIVTPRDVFRTALLAHATSVVVGHNHPSGHVEPSPDDVALTKTLSAAGVLVGVELLDHLIVSADGHYFSFKEAGLL